MGDLLNSKRIRWSLVAAGGILALSALALNAPPSGFPVNEEFRVEKGSSLMKISLELEKEKVIKSPLLFRSYVILFGGERGLVQGDYIFKTRITTWSVARRIMGGRLGIIPIRVTLPEGSTTLEMSDVISKKLPNFNKSQFLSLSKGKEGYLFPDTYLFFPTATTADVLKRLEETFNQKTEPVKVLISISKRELSEIVIMASILEEEARTTESRRMISGILWKRISIGMPLQVDAPFIYERGKDTFELTTRDLATDSPYNTYTRKGLPPTPISNPGLDSIRAALDPIESKYLYYLSDMKGEMHYAVTHEEHVRNKQKYLK